MEERTRRRKKGAKLKSYYQNTEGGEPKALTVTIINIILVEMPIKSDSSLSKFSKLEQSSSNFEQVWVLVSLNNFDKVQTSLKVFEKIWMNLKKIDGSLKKFKHRLQNMLARSVITVACCPVSICKPPSCLGPLMPASLSAFPSHR